MDWKRKLNPIVLSADVPSVIWFLARHCLELPRNRGLFLHKTLCEFSLIFANFEKNGAFKFCIFIQI